MKSFNNYLTIIQESNQNESSDKLLGNWKEATKSRGIPGVFEYSDLLDDWKDPFFKDRWKNITIEIEGEIIENYANTGYNVFRETKTGKFYYLDTHKL
jgi:hypothetical protein